MAARVMQVGETWGHAIVGGRFIVTQYDGYWISKTDTGGRQREHRGEGFYELPDEQGALGVKLPL